jgi:hypothetical protein
MTLFWSCKEGEIINHTPSNFNSNVLKDEAVDGEIELGLKKEDPNSLKNMLIALKSIQKDDARFKEISIEPNFKYVRVEPTTEEAQW